MADEKSEERLRHGWLTRRIIGCAMAVHSALGPGLLEGVYEECLCRELDLAGIPYARQVRLPICYKGLQLDSAYRLDVVVDQAVLVELKAVEGLLPVHEAQVMTYLRLSGLPVGLLLNFNTTHMRAGIKRFVSG